MHTMTLSSRARTRAALRRFGAVMASAALLVGGSLVAPQAASAADPTLTFFGHGWGHGRGMGQYGALGYAVDYGWSYKQILDRYYGGTVLATDAGNPTIGVQITRLNGGYPSGQFFLVAGQSLVVGGQAMPAGTTAVLLSWNGSSFDVSTSNGTANSGCGGPWVPAGIPAANPGVEISSAADPNVTTNGVPNGVRICEDGKTTGMRGTLQATTSGATPILINKLPIDSYLLSVVPSESPSSWGNLPNGMEALKAQAVAARSYALSGPTGTICDTTACQVYSGSFALSAATNQVTWVESANATQAVQATSGQVRRFPTAPYPIARTEFSSSTGGYTAGGTFPAVEDLGDARSPYHNWNVTLSQAAVASALGTSPINSIAVTGRNGLGAEGGRVTQVTVRGTDGKTWTFTGDQVRSRLGLRSDWFSISGVTQEQATKLVNALYSDILGRMPDPTGLGTWTQYVMATGDSGPVSQGIVTSNERVYNFVQRQYQTGLGRQPDPEGTQTWVNLMYAGMTVPELQVQVYASQESLNIHGNGDLNVWVDAVYQGILGRPAAPSEQAQWVRQVPLIGVQGVVRTIVLSDESALRRLNEYYQLMLGRDADPSGIATYKPMMNGQGDFILPVEIGRSVEYFNRAQTRF